MEIKLDKVDRLCELSELRFGDCFETTHGGFYMKTQQRTNHMTFDCVNLDSGVMTSIKSSQKVTRLKAVVTLTNFVE